MRALVGAIDPVRSGIHRSSILEHEAAGLRQRVAELKQAQQDRDIFRDMLRDAGYGDEEISAYRERWQAQHDANVPQQAGRIATLELVTTDPL